MADGASSFFSLLAFSSCCFGICFGKAVPEKESEKDSSLFGRLRRCIRRRVDRIKNRNKVACDQEIKKSEKPEEIASAENLNRRYKIIRLLGQGFYGSVYQAEDLKYEKLVAIKSLDITKNTIEKIKNEAFAMRVCQHSNVVKYIRSHIDLQKDKFWIVMEYVAGVRLADIVNECHINEGHIAAVARECLQALEFIHQKNIVHGDVHSQNILVGLDGSVKLADFGACVILQDETRNEISTKIDIWGVGMAVVEMLDTDIQVFDLTENQGTQEVNSSLEVLDFADRCMDGSSASELLEHTFLQSATSLEELKPLVLAAKDNN